MSRSVIQIAALIGWVLMTAFLPAVPAPARELTAAEAAVGLTPFASDEGLARLARAEAKVNFAALANQFEAEYLGAFCGPASAAMVLNAVFEDSAALPRDRSRFRPDDLKYLPPCVDPTLGRFTQDSVIERAKKTRAQVLGEPVEINGKMRPDFGFQLRQLDEMLRANGLATKAVVVDDTVADDQARADLVAALGQRGRYVIVAFQRKALGEPGFGHISPLGAYDKASDSFLMLDVNPAHVDWMWVPAAALIKAMRTFDTVENRGYVLVDPK